METICEYSRRPVCPQCRGPVYRCDPEKNRECRKTFCGECGYTSRREYAADPTPVCPRVRAGESP